MLNLEKNQDLTIGIAGIMCVICITTYRYENLLSISSLARKSLVDLKSRIWMRAEVCRIV